MKVRLSLAKLCGGWLDECDFVLCSGTKPMRKVDRHEDIAILDQFLPSSHVNY